MSDDEKPNQELPKLFKRLDKHETEYVRDNFNVMRVEVGQWGTTTVQLIDKVNELVETIHRMSLRQQQADIKIGSLSFENAELKNRLNEECNRNNEQDERIAGQNEVIERARAFIQKQREVKP